MASKVQKQTQHYQRTKDHLDHYCPSLTQISCKQFKSMCQENFPKFRSPKQNLEIEGIQENPTSSDPVSVNYHFYHNLPAGEKKDKVHGLQRKPQNPKNIYHV